MKIVDIWKQNRNMFAYCVGENIDANFSCKKILLNKKLIDVKAVDVQISLMGDISATLKFDETLEDDIQTGKFTIIN